VNVPAVANVCDIVAVPNAATGDVVLSPTAAVGTTLAVPMEVPFAKNVTVPVGPAPLLWVNTPAVRVTGVTVVAVVAPGTTLAVVGAGVTVTTRAGEVLAV
jgi:hypothetical protein